MGGSCQAIATSSSATWSNEVSIGVVRRLLLSRFRPSAKPRGLVHVRAAFPTIPQQRRRKLSQYAYELHDLIDTSPKVSGAGVQ
jgi:hypothetical protein